MGLGPAGVVFAQNTDSRFKVLALDKKSENGGGFEKMCGGLLAPDAQKELSRFNLTLPKRVLADPQIFSVCTLDLDSGLARYYQRHYINLNRLELNRYLISLVPPSVKIEREAQCTVLERTADGCFEVGYRQRGTEKTVCAKCVVGADGAAFKVRAALFGGFKIESLLAVQESFSSCRAAPSYLCVFDSALTNSYAWGLSKDGKFLLGGAFQPKDGVKNFEALKGKLAAHGFNLGRPLSRRACLVLRPRGGRICAGKDGAFLIGEAAGLISPSSLEGISYAIESGRALAMSFNSVQPFKSYLKALCPLKRKLRLKGFKRAVLNSPFLRKLIMKSGLSALKMPPQKT